MHICVERGTNWLPWRWVKLGLGFCGRERRLRGRREERRTQLGLGFCGNTKSSDGNSFFFSFLLFAISDLRLVMWNISNLTTNIITLYILSLIQMILLLLFHYQCGIILDPIKSFRLILIFHGSHKYSPEHMAHNVYTLT